MFLNYTSFLERMLNEANKIKLEEIEEGAIIH